MPKWITRQDGGAGRPLQRLNLAAAGLNEAWLQRTLFENPDLLLAGQVDVAFADPRPVRMEMLVDGGDGYRAIDALYLTPAGGIVLVEVKLVSNAEARRGVVAQALEYAGALRRLGAAGMASRAGRSLYEAAGAAGGGLDAEEFGAIVDTNLRRGRLLLLIALDRARRDLQSLVEDLRSMPGLPFEIGLLEVACYADTRWPDDLLVVPRLAHVLRAIERPVVPFEPGAAAPPAARVGAAGRPTPLQEAEFLELLDRAHPGAGDWLLAFAEQLAGLGVGREVVRTMTLRAVVADGVVATLAVITAAGEVQIYPATRGVLGLPGGGTAVRTYLSEVAQLIGGCITGEGGPALRPASSHIMKDGRYPRITDLREQAGGWMESIERFLAALSGGSGFPSAAA